MSEAGCRAPGVNGKFLPKCDGGVSWWLEKERWVAIYRVPVEGP